MEAPVKGHHSHSLVEARLRHDGLLADAAPRRKLLVEVFDAVDLVGGVHGELYTIERLVADHARETARVIGLAGGPQDALQDGLCAHAALLQGVQVAVLAVGLAVDSIKCLALKLKMAHDAVEAADMEHLIHGGAAAALSHHLPPTPRTDTEELRVAAALHGLHQQTGEGVHLGLLGVARIGSLRPAGGVWPAATTGIHRRRSVSAAAGRHLAGGARADGLVEALVASAHFSESCKNSRDFGGDN